MNAPVTIPPEVLNEASAAEHALEVARTYPVPTSAGSYSAAGDELKAIKARAKWLEDARTKLKAPILAAGKAIDDFFRTPQQHLADAEKAIKGAMLTYDRQQEELRKAAERKAAEAARKEQDRLRAEAARAEAAAREKREKEEAAARRKREAEDVKARALKEAGRAEEAARRRAAAEEAERVRMEAAAESERQRLQAAEASRLAAETMPTTPVVHVAAPKVAGISTREVWSAEVVDKAKLIVAVAVGVMSRQDIIAIARHAGLTAEELTQSIPMALTEAPAELLEVSMVTANKMAKALKGGMQYPGLKAVCTQQMAARA